MHISSHDSGAPSSAVSGSSPQCHRKPAGRGDIKQPARNQIDRERLASPALDDEHGLVVDAVLFIDLSQVLVLLHCVLQDRVTNFFRPLILMVADHSLDLESVLFVLLS